MPPGELRDALDALHWSQRDLADLLGCNERLVRRWAAGSNAVPPGIADWLRLRLAAHRAAPPPADWKRRAA